MHAWLWMQDFPPLPAWLEEGLCELGSFLYLLELVHDPAASCLASDAAMLRAQLGTIELNARQPYGSGFRACAAALRGRGLHDLLQHVRAYGALPEQRALPPTVSAPLPSQPPPGRQARARA
eukprot:scaffold9712_cov108-Isochrysis_galbana.AAC.2